MLFGRVGEVAFLQTRRRIPTAGTWPLAQRKHTVMLNRILDEKLFLVADVTVLHAEGEKPQGRKQKRLKLNL